MSLAKFITWFLGTKPDASNDEVQSALEMYDDVANYVRRTTADDQREEATGYAPDPEIVRDVRIQRASIREKARHASPKANNTTTGHSTRDASITDLSDWVTIEDAAAWVGHSVDETFNAISNNGLDVIRFDGPPQVIHLYHRRQVGYWFKNHKILPVDRDVFVGWARVADTAREFNVEPWQISELHRAGRIAVYHPHLRLTLVNTAEVAKRIRGKA